MLERWIERALGLLLPFAVAFPAFVICMIAAALTGCGGHWGDDEESFAPLGNSVNRVDALFAAAPSFLTLAQTSERMKLTRAMVPHPDGRLDRTYVQIDYGGRGVVYEATHDLVSIWEGVTAEGYHVVLIYEYQLTLAGQVQTGSVVLVEGSSERAPLQSLAYQACGETRQAPIVDIREFYRDVYGDWWIILRAEAKGRGWRVERWAMLHVRTGYPFPFIYGVTEPPPCG